MFNDRFKNTYKTIPFAIYRAYSANKSKDGILHQHKEIELIGMTEGCVDFYVNSTLYHLEKGDVLVIPPYALHKVRISSDTVAGYYCICFDPELLCDSEIKAKLEDNEKHLVDKGSEYAHSVLKHIENAFIACEKNESGWEFCAMGNIFLMFGLLKKNGFFLQSAKHKGNTNFGKSVMAYIIDNYSSDTTSSRSAADELYMNYSYFCRLFKKTFGSPFSNYLLIYRLEKAKTFLSGTDMTITEIALNVGINNCSYFCKAFKNRTGVTPLAYRKNH